MSGLDKIKERILKDAGDEAERILADAKAKADEIRKAYEKRAEEAAAKIKAEYDTQCEELRSRMLSAAELDMRKKVLEVKQSVIDKAFEQCLDYIAKMPVDEYKALIEKLLLQSVQSGDEEVIFSAFDDNRLDSYLITDVNEKLRSMGRKGALKLSQEKGSFKGGFVLRSAGIAGDLEINSTFESILHTTREQIEPQVARCLELA